MTLDARHAAKEVAALAAAPLSWVRRTGLYGFTDEALAEALAARGFEARTVTDFDGARRFDGIFLELRTAQEEDACSVVHAARAKLATYGALYLVLPPALRGTEMLARLIQDAGLLAYQYLEPAPDATLHSVEKAHAPEGVPLLAMVAAEDYDPLAHAQSLLEAGQPGWSLEVLEHIPEALVRGDEAWGLIHAERLRCLLEYDKLMGPEGRLNRFARAQDDFYKATTYLPRHAPAFLDWSTFWRRMDRIDRARATLNTLEHLAGTEAILEPRELRGVPDSIIQEVTAPVWRGDGPRRILYVMRPPADYGTDVLYDGLCTVLGDDNVLEYPWKPTLHGQDLARAGAYPCTFNRAGDALPLEALLEELRAGRFDAVLYSDVFQEVPGGEVRAIMAAAGTTPIFIVDNWDQCGDYNATVRAHMGDVDVRAVFKREMIAGVEYGPDFIPFTFAYPDDRIPQTVTWEGREGCFWAGKPQLGLRRTYLEWLTERLGFDATREYPQEEYLRAVRGAAFGLSLFGNGYDTVRYWELPANGCMLLSERPPIRIPNNFVDGESAVFFDDLPELDEKMRHYLAHPEACREIAQAGHAHLRTHHTGSARAKELLAHIRALT